MDKKPFIRISYKMDDLDDEILEISLEGIPDDTTKERIRRKVRRSPPKEKLNVLRESITQETGRELVNAQRKNTSGEFDRYIENTISNRHGAIGFEPTSNQIIDLAVKRYLLDGINPVARIRKLQEPYQNDSEGATARVEFIAYVKRQSIRFISKIVLLIISALLLATSVGMAIWGLTTQVDSAMIATTVLSSVALVWILVVGTLYLIYNTTTYAVLTGVGAAFAVGAAVAWFFAPVSGVPFLVLDAVSFVFIIIIASI
jgi:hypothetical protein